MFNSVVIGCAVLLCLVPAQVFAGCLVGEAAPGAAGLFKMHLSATCTPAEREAHAVEVSAVLEALKRGQTVDLHGVLIRGDLMLDTLPVVTDLSAFDGIVGPQEKEVRVIASEVSIVNSVVRGRILHRSPDGTLIFSGPVTFVGTTFEQMVDLSRSIFTQPVTLSGAVFLAEGYFVQNQFYRELTCEKTAFGRHTRFHRSRFREPVVFEQSGFSGLAQSQASPMPSLFVSF